MLNPNKYIQRYIAMGILMNTEFSPPEEVCFLGHICCPKNTGFSVDRLMLCRTNQFQNRRNVFIER